MFRKLIVALFAFLATSSCASPYRERVFESYRGATVFSDAKTKALVDAACSGDVEGVQRLVKAGADPNAEGLLGMTPLGWSIGCENFRGFRALLDAGADPEKTFDEGKYAPLSTSVNMPDDRFMKHLISIGADVDPAGSGNTLQPIDAAIDWHDRTGKWERFDYLVQQGLDMNRKRAFERTRDVYWDTNLFELFYASKPCKAVEYVDRGDLANALGILNVLRNQLYDPKSEHYRCVQSMIATLSAQIDPEEYEKFAENSEKVKVCLGKGPKLEGCTVY